MSTKTRISKKSLAEFPAPVAEAIKNISDDYGIASMTYEPKPEGYGYYIGEGDRVQVVMNDRSKSIQTVSESTLGAAGLFHGIGTKVTAPAGAFILVVSYYTKYFLTVYNIGLPALAK
jgi:hypothetical protein